MLVRAGFVRQAHAGIFQLLPLGLRVQEKLEQLIDKHMLRISASKLSLSSLSSQKLWKKSGRLEKSNQELFRLEDRKGAKFLLSPTHEEEITSLVGTVVKSYRDLPLRLYQVSRKYRDERRPRQGLLRGREFLMKDLYTFDISSDEALATYQNVRQSYDAIFEELKVPYLVAKADSGSIGGDLSHEYHVPSIHGEDSIITCSGCGYAVNEELTGDQVICLGNEVDTMYRHHTAENVGLWRGIFHDRSTIVEVAYPKAIGRTDSNGRSQARPTELSTAKIKYLLPEVDLSVDLSLEAGLNHYHYDAADRDGTQKVLRLNDYRVADDALGDSTTAKVPEALLACSNEAKRFDFTKPLEGDRCSRCSNGAIKVTKAIELGHTFHLGTRYSEPLGLSVAAKPSHQASKASIVSPPALPVKAPLQMGCHGIGLSRMIAAVASIFADSKGLNWPTLMAPFQVVVIPRRNHEDAAISVYELLSGMSSQPREPGSTAEMGNSTIDAIVDDRDRDFIWKMNDADLIGYPVIVLLGSNWVKERSCEVQCRRLKIKENVPVDALRTRVWELLDQL